jgi:hypothetical protein
MLRRLIALGLLAAVATVLCRDDVSAQDKMAPPKDSDNLAAGEYFGTMLVTPGSDRSFTLRLEQKNLVPTGGGKPAAVPVAMPRWAPALNPLLAKVLGDQRNYQNQVAAAARARTPAARASAGRNVANAAATLRNSVIAFNRAALAIGIAEAHLLAVASGSSAPQFTVRTVTQDVEFQATESVKVRTMVLPEQFDEKGNVKKYTRAELNELKGKDKNLPGFESSLEKLEVGQKVRVLLVQSSKKPAPAPKKDKDKEKDKDKKANDDEKRMQVKMITIVETEGDAAAAPKGKKN